MEDQLLELQETITRLSLENDRLLTQIQTQKELLNQVQDTMLCKTPVRRQPSEAQKAKMDYYKQHKRDSKILEQVRTDLDKLGYTTVKTLPWQLIKYHTDKQYASNGVSKQDVGSQPSSHE